MKKICKNCKYFTVDIDYPRFGECTELTFDTGYDGLQYDETTDIIMPNCYDLIGDIILVRDTFGCVRFTKK